MLVSLPEDIGVMGVNAHYRPGLLNSNIIVNELFAPADVRAFPDSAIIIQKKKIPDVSFWQGEIDWDAMREKTDTVIIRAGQNVWEDIQFKRNWEEARKRGMLRAPYYFYDDRVSPGAQAEKWHALLRDDPPELEAITDWENTYGGQFKGLSNVVAMMERMEAYGYLSALYTGYFWFRANSNTFTNASHYAYLKQRPLHLAWYSSDASLVMIPAPWSDLWMWQYGTPAEDYGQKSEEIDMNFVNLTEVNFYKRYGGVIPVPPPEPPTGEPMPILIGEVIVSELNIRPTAGTTQAAIGRLRLGDRIEASEEVSGWWKITKITSRAGANVPLPGPTCYAYEGLNNGYIKELTPAPTPAKTITRAVVYFSDGTLEELVPSP